MLGRFTDNARAIIQKSFRRGSIASERAILAAIAGGPPSLAKQVMSSAGVEAGSIPPNGVVLDRFTLIAQAVTEGRRLGVNYVGTEHFLLAVARNPDSHLHQLGSRSG